MQARQMNMLERRYGIDLNGDGYIGGEGYLSRLERATGRDINGDGILGRAPDVARGYPGVYGHSSMGYANNGQFYGTNNFAAPQTNPYYTYPSQQFRYF
ncbi:hypothetical protein I4U23_021316 [Adineta vaga]|nr:hypothetical protein I4U23_021316 [Adineta vaga]